MKVAAGLILALVALPAVAEPLPVRLADGATWTMTLDHQREEVRDGTAKSWTVKSVNQLTWAPGRLTVRPVSVTPGPGAPSELTLAQGEGLAAELAVEDDLTPLRILNWPQVKAGLLAAIDRIATPDPSSAAATAATKSLVDGLTDASATALVTRDLGMVALGQGSDLTAGETFDYEDRIPNPLGGGPITSKASFTLEAYDARAGRAVVSWRQTTDPMALQASIKNSLESLAAQIAPDRVAEARAALSKMSLERADACRYDIDIPTGLAVRADCTSTIRSSDGARSGSRTDRRIFTQTLPQTSAKTN